eukprot:20279-Heterococcus_DN1.PRE.1
MIAHVHNLLLQSRSEPEAGGKSTANRHSSYIDLKLTCIRRLTGSGRLKLAAIVPASLTVNRRYVGIGTGFGLVDPNIRVNACRNIRQGYRDQLIAYPVFGDACCHVYNCCANEPREPAVLL